MYRQPHFMVLGPAWMILPESSGWKKIQSASSESHFISCTPFLAFLGECRSIEYRLRNLAYTWLRMHIYSINCLKTVFQNDHKTHLLDTASHAPKPINFILTHGAVDSLKYCIQTLKCVKGTLISGNKRWTMYQSLNVQPSPELLAPFIKMNNVRMLYSFIYWFIF